MRPSAAKRADVKALRIEGGEKGGVVDLGIMGQRHEGGVIGEDLGDLIGAASERRSNAAAVAAERGVTPGHHRAVGLQRREG